MIINSRFFNRSELIGFVALAVLLFLILPLTLDVFRLNLVAKYLTYAFVAIGLVLCWGYGGILSLGQGVFFGLGGYCMAMYLKLEASSVENTKIQSTPGIPDFMDWNQITQLPFFWKPFHSFPLTILGIILVPAIFAFIIGAAMFKRRVGGVYFAIITQAVAHSHHPDRRPAGLHRRHQRDHRPAHAARLGYPHRPRQIHPVFRRSGAAVRMHHRRAIHPPDQA